MNHGLSRKMKALWADPEWAARQRERIAEGQANSPHRPGRPVSAVRKATKRNTVPACVHFDPEQFESVRLIAEAEGKSFSEIVRTFVEWGLEESVDTASKSAERSPRSPSRAILP